MTNKTITRTLSVPLCVLILALTLSASAAFAAKVHKIKQGDTLWDIAKKYKTTPEKLAKANHLSEKQLLKLDSTIRVPGVDAPKSHKKIAQSKNLTHKQKMLAKAKAAKLHAAKVKHLAAVKAAKSHKVAKAKPAVKAAVVKGKGQMKVVRTALAYQGARYRSGGTSRGGFDCSGFTRYVYAKYGVSLPHSSAAQARVGRPVPRGQLKPGDIVYFHTYRRGPSHVGIYTGNNKFVHASTHGRGVVVDSLGSSYYASRYMGARRVK